MAEVRWGILGTAGIAASQFIPAVRASQHGTLEAVAARELPRAQAFADRHGARRALVGYGTLLTDPDVDAVYIPLPNSLHAEWAIAAARAGKHVLCEKPLAADAPEAARVAAECERAGVVAIESFVYHYHPQTLQIAQWLRDGAIGEVLGAHATFHFKMSPERFLNDIRMSPELAGGALMDVGCYPISWLRFVFGEEPSSVTAHGAFNGEGGVDTHIAGLLHFARGRTGSFSASFDADWTLQTRVVGSAGEIIVEKPYHPRGAAATVRLLRVGHEAAEHCLASNEPSFLAALEHFHACVLEGRRPLVGLGDAVANMAVMDAVRRSALAHGASESVRQP